MFRVGDKVVHPVHGAGTVAKVEERMEDGEPVLYYIIPDALASCQLMVPVACAETIGLRPAMPQSSLDAVYDAIRDGGTDGDSAEETDAPGEAAETIEVARMLGRLLHKERDKTLSQAERRQLDRLKRLLVGELSLVTGYAESRVSTLIEDCVIAVPAEQVDAAVAKRKK